MQAKDVEIGSQFMHEYHMYMRVQDIPQIKREYPDSITAVCMDNYKIVLLHENYEVGGLIIDREVSYE